MTDTQGIAYRRMVVSLAKELSPEEVRQIAYIRLTGVESDCKYTSTPPTASGLDLLARLERLGVFSQKCTEGLLDIAKDVNRHDLVKKIEDYRKNASSAVRYRKKKQRGLLSEERQQLEETFEMMVTQFAVLEQHVSLLQRALDGEQDDALEVLRLTGVMVQEMGSKLGDVHKRLARRSVASSNSSGSDSRPNSGEISRPNSGEVGGPLDSALQQNVGTDPVSNLPGQMHSPQLHHPPLSQQKRRKPVPKPRKPRNQQYPPIQETVEQSSVTARLPVECEDDKESHRVSSKEKPPIRPRTHSLKSKSLYSVNSSMTNHTPAGEDPTDSDDDVTGDSGMGTGSGSARYGGVEEWRRGINAPPPSRTTVSQPPVSTEHNYEPISVETKDPVLLYQVLRRKPNQ